MRHCLEMELNNEEQSTPKQPPDQRKNALNRSVF